MTENEIVRRFITTDELPTYEDITENWDHSDARTITVLSAKRDTVNGRVGYWVEFQYDDFNCWCGNTYSEPNEFGLCSDCFPRIDAHMDRVHEYSLQCSEIYEPASTDNDEEIGGLVSLIEKHLAAIKLLLEGRKAPF